jgi:hypothetical protein
MTWACDELTFGFASAVQEHLQKNDGGVALHSLLRNDIVGLLCCPLTAGAASGSVQAQC